MREKEREREGGREVGGGERDSVSNSERASENAFVFVNLGVSMR